VKLPYFLHSVFQALSSWPGKPKHDQRKYEASEDAAGRHVVVKVATNQQQRQSKDQQPYPKPDYLTIPLRSFDARAAVFLIWFIYSVGAVDFATLCFDFFHCQNSRAEIAVLFMKRRNPS
jgi:hypothetical protein